MVKGMIPGATGSVVNMEEIEEGDEVRAFFRVRGNKVKEVKGVVSEISQKGYVRLRTCGRWLKVVRKIASLEKCGGSKERTSKNKKINGISARVGDRVTIMAGQLTQITGVVSAISKKGTRLLIATLEDFEKVRYRFFLDFFAFVDASTFLGVGKYF